MHRLFATMKALVEGGASIQSAGKSRVSRTPGEVSQGSHN